MLINPGIYHLVTASTSALIVVNKSRMQIKPWLLVQFIKSDHTITQVGLLFCAAHMSTLTGNERDSRVISPSWRSMFSDFQSLFWRADA